MAREVRSRLELDADIRESNTLAGAAQATAHLAHNLVHTDLTEYEAVYSDRLTLTTTPTDLSLDGLTSKLSGAAVAFTAVNVLIVKHVSGAGNALVGADGTAPLALTSADTESIPVLPGGLLYLNLGATGSAVANGSTDILQLAASAGTVVVDVVILGSES
jgi:hypothetical protein